MPTGRERNLTGFRESRWGLACSSAALSVYVGCEGRAVEVEALRELGELDEMRRANDEDEQ